MGDALAVALISLEVLLWGSIGLARSIFQPGEVIFQGQGTALAQGLALVLRSLLVIAGQPLPGDSDSGPDREL